MGAHEYNVNILQYSINIVPTSTQLLGQRFPTLIAAITHDQATEIGDSRYQQGVVLWHLHRYIKAASVACSFTSY